MLDGVQLIGVVSTDVAELRQRAEQWRGRLVLEGWAEVEARVQPFARVRTAASIAAAPRDGGVHAIALRLAQRLKSAARRRGRLRSRATGGSGGCASAAARPAAAPTLRGCSG